MAYSQQIAEQSKDEILKNFSESTEQLSSSFVDLAITINLVVSVIIIVIVLIFSLLLFPWLVVNDYTSAQNAVIVFIVVIVLTILALILVSAVSVESMKKKTSILAKNAVNVLGSENAITSLNEVFRIYNENTA
jgi:hypothetical protein